jgi:DNA-directed RNA polymerase II subunit RPB7
MFFLKDLTQRIQLHPECFGPSLQMHITDRLHRDVEGTCTGRHGYIISVLNVKSISHGTILDGLGYAEFTITFQAIVFKPWKGQVVDATVCTVNKMGFFGEVGPLTVFVSCHLLGNEMQFEQGIGGSAAYVGMGSAAQQRIAVGDQVRVRIIGTRVDATEIFAIGTIKEDYLGLISAAM